MKLFQKIARMTQPQLKKWLLKRYIDKGFTCHNEDGFLYLEPKGDADPICLTAHMDTVHKERVKEVQIEKHPNKTILSSPQGIGGDDRCGIYMIVKLLDSGYSPHVIFCEDEEIGCVGAKKFALSGYAKKMIGRVNFIVELDRRNANDAVYYSLDNEDFESFVTETTGYKTASGSFSDICEIAPRVGVAAVNLSCGYYKEHTLEHYVVWEEMLKTLDAAEQLIKASKGIEAFEYKELKYDYLYDYGGYVAGTFTWIEDGEIKSEYYDGYNRYEVVGSFMWEHPELRLIDVNVNFETY